MLAKNDVLAEQNRQWLADRRILAFNVTLSPGAGKTTLLEHTIRRLGAQRQVWVIEGDQETLLDAEMIERALRALEPDDDSLLFIEYVGNLVCPALFDLGVHSKVVVISSMFEILAQHARSVNPEVEILPVSATKGDGMEHWFQWIDAHAS